MPQQKLMIVPVTPHPDTESSLRSTSSKDPSTSICTIKTAKANGVDFYQYLVKLLTDLPNLDIHQNLEILKQYMPWSKNIQAACRK